MGFLDRLLGRAPKPQTHPYQTTPSPAYPQDREQPAYPAHPPAHPGHGAGSAEDQRAIARYRYLLRTAPPDQIEQAHHEAFARLSPDQREQVLAELSRELPPGERVASSDPATLARAATRAEVRQPGFLERTFAGPPRGGMGGVGMGGMFAGSMLGTIAGVVVGSAIAESLFDGYEGSPEAQDDPTAAGADSGGEAGDPGATEEAGGDHAAADVGGSDFGGGDFGGGDFGGGDFGGGDF